MYGHSVCIVADVTIAVSAAVFEQMLVLLFAYVFAFEETGPAASLSQDMALRMLFVIDCLFAFLFALIHIPVRIRVCY